MARRRFEYPSTDDLAVVVRAAGERTERACVELFAEQLAEPDQIRVIHEKPFSRAVEACFQIGISSGRPWLIAVDADILPLGDAVERAREICGKMARDAFCATPLFLCRTVGGLAMRGLHCYRTSLLRRALDLTPTLPDDLRPESRYHEAMKGLGFGREVYAKVLGLHEYEQSYRHVYLKSMLRARKDPYAARMRDRLAANAVEDTEAMVALWGFEDASHDGPTEYDWEAPLPRFERRMASAGFVERGPLDVSGVRGLPLQRVLAHDYRADRETEPWIRDMLAFAEGAPGLLDAVHRPPRFSAESRVQAGTA